MVAILVTGMSGTGRSTALAELARRGSRVVDTDSGGYAVEVWSAEEGRPEQLWREDRIDVLRARHEQDAAGEPLFVAGCVSGQGRFRPRFAAVVLLSAPVDVLLRRLAGRTTNGFGESDAERLLGGLAAVEPLLRATADAGIDTRAPAAEVADRLVAIARDVG
ncbi:shikimate kinase [Geodermatophilus amargosae]|uniref:Shikimate kinase n=1 Tax=Geodermatophilus amargosae TaxID=1296565 RepID=A0A1I7CWS4_9ACTN|nr:AAA family ATPase [Geodermatophilus amargosae]SFU03912.1 shikimate kinase [Geodermatophilus amargosae]